MCRPNVLQLLHVAVLWLYLRLPSVLCENLRCFFSPVRENEKTVKLSVTLCPIDELCFKGEGRYGNHSTLSARGCMAQKDCSQVHQIRNKGVIYHMSYDCCAWPYCNSCPGLTAKYLYIMVTLVTVAVMAGSL
ncbi:protein Bouncer [Sebastes umbrosus]|uniref:protein Bouncer n=1 Tax=Sebastes umbrosus TaxID=72105 RepID=UPI0018A078AB|nr:protein Bouncer [Sebastes umbrosus]